MKSRHNLVFAMHPSCSLFSGWNLDPLQCTMTSKYEHILVVQRCLHSHACFFRGNNDGRLCRCLQANSESHFYLGSSVPHALPAGAWQLHCFCLPGLYYCITHRKTCLRSARGQASSNSSSILSMLHFTCPLSGEAADSFISRSSFLSRLTCHPC